MRYGCRALVGLRADDVKAVSIERLYLSLLMWKNLSLKDNKKFHTWTDFVKFCVFRFPTSISHVRISGYVTKRIEFIWMQYFFQKLQEDFMSTFALALIFRSITSITSITAIRSKSIISERCGYLTRHLIVWEKPADLFIIYVLFSVPTTGWMHVRIFSSRSIAL